MRMKRIIFCILTLSLSLCMTANDDLHLKQMVECINDSDFSCAYGELAQVRDWTFDHDILLDDPFLIVDFMIYIEDIGLYPSTYDSLKIYVAVEAEAYGQMYVGEHQYAEAIPYCNLAYVLRTDVGDITFDYADVTFVLAQLYYETAEYDDAIEYYEKAVPLLEATLGENNAQYISTLNRIGVRLFNARKKDEAMPYFEQALDKCERFLGKEYPLYLTIVENLGQIYYNHLNKPQKAEPYLVEAAAIRQLQAEEDRQAYVDALTICGRNYFMLYTMNSDSVGAGKYLKKGEQYFHKAMDVQKKALGTLHSDYIELIEEFAHQYALAELYEKSEKYYLKALDAKKAAYGPQSSEYAEALSKMGARFTDNETRRNYKKAEQYLLKALTIQEEQSESDHSALTATLNNLGGLYLLMGQFQKADRYLQQALALALSTTEDQQEELDHYVSLVHKRALDVYYMGDTVRSLQIDDIAVKFALAHHAGNCSFAIDDRLDSAKIAILRHDYTTADAILTRAATIQENTNTPIDPVLVAQRMLVFYRTERYEEGWQLENYLIANPKAAQYVAHHIAHGEMYYGMKTRLIFSNSSITSLTGDGISFGLYNTSVENAQVTNADVYTYEEQPEFGRVSDSIAYTYEHVEARVMSDSLKIEKQHISATNVRADRFYLNGVCDVIQRSINNGDYVTAETFCTHAREIALHYQDSISASYMAVTSYYMALINSYKGEWQEAVKQIKSAYAYYSDIDNLEMMAQLLVLYSEYYQHFANSEQALDYAIKAANLYDYISQSNRNTDRTCYVFLNLAKCLIDDGNLDDGLGMLSALVDYLADKQNDNQFNLAKVYLQYLTYATQYQDYDAGIKSFEYAQEILLDLKGKLLSENRYMARLFGKEYIDLYTMGAQICLDIHNDSLAEVVSEKALEYAIEIYGENHPYVFPPLLLQSQALQRCGKLEGYTLRNMIYGNELAKRLYGSTHWMVGETQWRLAELVLARHDIRSFEQHIDTITQIFTHNIRHEFTFLTAKQREYYWERQSKILSTILRNAFYLQTPQINKAAFNTNLLLKGMLLKTQIEIANIIANSNDSVLYEQYLTFLDLQDQQRLALEHNLPFSDEKKAEKEHLEQIIQQKALEYGDFTTALGVRMEDILQSLSSEQVALEYMSVPLNEDSTMYCALLLRDTCAYPNLIPLFEEKELLALVNTSTESRTNGTYSVDGNGEALQQLVWSKILPYVKPGETIYFAPSGALHQVAIEALPYDETHTMGDKYHLVRLSSTREIVLNKSNETHTTASLYGGILYDVDSTTIASESRKYEDVAVSRGIENDTLDRGSVKYLPGTKREVENIDKMLKDNNLSVQLFTMTSANEESFKALSGTHQNILHIATHGFYWSDSTAQKKDYFSQRVLTMDDNLLTPPAIDPLNRCGLLFAGANTALSGHSADLPEGVQDGILTAKEISLLDLRDADLVVLSACETGKGEITGEGVFGLQRAFKQAGAQTIIMSLWPVNDAATQMLMTEFYRNWITNHQPKREAFRKAQNTVRTQFEEPVYWAGFIMLD